MGFCVSICRRVRRFRAKPSHALPEWRSMESKHRIVVVRRLCKSPCVTLRYIVVLLRQAHRAVYEVLIELIEQRRTSRLLCQLPGGLPIVSRMVSGKIAHGHRAHSMERAVLSTIVELGKRSHKCPILNPTLALIAHTSRDWHAGTIGAAANSRWIERCAIGRLARRLAGL